MYQIYYFQNSTRTLTFLYISVITVLEFHSVSVEIQEILHPNEYSQRFLLYLSRQLSSDPTKMGHVFTKQSLINIIKNKDVEQILALLVLYPLRNPHLDAKIN